MAAKFSTAPVKFDFNGIYLNMLLTGPSGAGKTWTSLELATKLAKELGGKYDYPALIDSEKGKARLYANDFVFAHGILDDYSPESYIEALRFYRNEGFKVVIVDSISHEWAGQNGILERVDGNATNWRKETPRHNKFIEEILGCKMHVICTARAKTEYVFEVNERGKQTPRKVGMGMVQRPDTEYDFDLVLDVTMRHVGQVGKTRFKTLTDKQFTPPNGDNLGRLLIDIIKGEAAESKPTTSSRLQLKPDSDQQSPFENPENEVEGEEAEENNEQEWVKYFQSQLHILRQESEYPDPDRESLLNRYSELREKFVEAFPDGKLDGDRVKRSFALTKTYIEGKDVPSSLLQLDQELREEMRASV